MSTQKYRGTVNQSRKKSQCYHDAAYKAPRAKAKKVWSVTIDSAKPRIAELEGLEALHRTKPAKPKRERPPVGTVAESVWLYEHSRWQRAGEVRT